MQFPGQPCLTLCSMGHGSYHRHVLFGSQLVSIIHIFIGNQHVLSHLPSIPASDGIVANNMFYLIHPLFQHQMAWWQTTFSFTIYSSIRWHSGKPHVVSYSPFYHSIRWHGGKQHVLSYSPSIPASDGMVANNMFYLIHTLFQHQMTLW